MEILPKMGTTSEAAPIVHPVQNLPENVHQCQPDVRAALITSRGDTLVLYQGVWRPVEKLPAEAQAEAARMAVPIDQVPKINLKATQAQFPDEPPTQESKPDSAGQLSLWGAA